MELKESLQIFTTNPPLIGKVLNSPTVLTNLLNLFGADLLKPKKPLSLGIMGKIKVGKGQIYPAAPILASEGKLLSILHRGHFPRQEEEPLIKFYFPSFNPSKST